MRTLTLTLALAFTLSACGGDNTSDSTSPTPTTSSPTPRSAPVSEAPESFDAVEDTLTDAEEFAVELEQVFFRTGYPDDLAGVIAAAEETDLRLAEGNTIAAYVFDPDTSEFQLCVQHTSGAWATYDTRPMSMRASGTEGGCPE